MNRNYWHSTLYYIDFVYAVVSYCNNKEEIVQRLFVHLINKAHKLQVIHACFLWQKSLYEICVATCDDWEDGHDLFPDKQFNMAGDR